MTALTLDALRPFVAEHVGPFLHEVVASDGQRLHSIHIVGSAVTGDFDPKSSDINSLLVLNDMDFQFLEALAPKGKKYGKKRIAAPFIMTPGYIASSADVFPVEFLSFRLLHETVYGEDILKDIALHPEHLRQQCERELKSKLVGLRQGYLSAAADTSMLTDVLVRTIAGSIALFRGIIMLYAKTPPALRAEVLGSMKAVTGIDTSVFESVIRLKAERPKLSLAELNRLFEDYYASVERLSKVVDEIKV